MKADQKHFVAFLLIIFLGLSCDCLQEVSGTVVDGKTGNPMDSVSYQPALSVDLMYTDSSGGFYSSGISGGLFGCPPKKLILRKPGYKTKRVIIANGRHKVVKMWRSK